MTPDRNTVLLARSEVCAVERCRDCGTIHLHLGDASIRVPPGGFAVLCETLLDALSGVPELAHEAWPFPRRGRA